jgi:peptidoglycan hydrolase-like protein with peptidoglycan-binding domain
MATTNDHASHREAESGREEALVRAPQSPKEPPQPGIMSPTAVQALQRTIGNAATGRVLARLIADSDAPLLKDRRPLLKRGMHGDDVLELQGQLNYVGAVPPLEQDAIFGPKTQAAVIAVQAENGLVTDGIVGPLTRAAMEASLHVSAEGPDILDREGSNGDFDVPAVAGNLLGDDVQQQQPTPKPAGDAEAQRIKRLQSSEGQKDFDDIHKGTSPEANCPAIANALSEYLDTGVKRRVRAGMAPKFSFKLSDRSPPMDAGSLRARLAKQPGTHVLVQGFRADGAEHWFNLVNDNGKLVVLDGWFGAQSDRVKPLDEYLKGQGLVKFHTFKKGARVTTEDPGADIIDPAGNL